MTEKLVVLDFSGTLCLAAPSFAAPGTLREELRRSGLADLGVTPGLFWSELVNPTWIAGSTTQAGYRRVLAERLEILLAQGSVQGRRDVISPAVSRFADRYFRACVIDPRWAPFLRACAGRPGLAAVIATDHYAEATEAILGSLAGFSLPADSLAGTGTPPSPSPGAIRVANSADLGVAKASREFWESLRLNLQNPALKGILLVDDFGSNEPAGDAYGEPERVLRRRRETVARLEEVFRAPVSCHVFTLGPAAMEAPADPGADPVAGRIAQALGVLERFLAS